MYGSAITIATPTPTCPPPSATSRICVSRSLGHPEDSPESGPREGLLWGGPPGAPLLGGASISLPGRTPAPSVAWVVLPHARLSRGGEEGWVGRDSPGQASLLWPSGPHRKLRAMLLVSPPGRAGRGQGALRSAVGGGPGVGTQPGPCPPVMHTEASPGHWWHRRKRRPQGGDDSRAREPLGRDCGGRGPQEAE